MAAAATVLLASAAPARAALAPTGLKTNALSQPLGIGDATPDFSWMLDGTGRAALQSAYEIRVASAESQLAAGPYLWQSGKVASDRASDVVYGGAPLPSRQNAVWQVRVWDTNGDVSAWSAPAVFETGLLAQSDWGSAKWIELAGRTTAQPLPIFGRGFALDKPVRSARLYMSGLGIMEPRVNGAKLTDEVLAPGYTNYQLSAEYRTYDVTSRLRNGANTIGVELGQGTAHNVKMPNPAAGVNRTNSFAWWSSSAVGNGTLALPAAAGDTNVKVSSVASYYVGGSINIDTGDGGDRLESRTITSIGTAATTTNTALALPAAAGDTNVKVNSVAGMNPGATLRIGQQSTTITSVGTAAVNSTLAAGTIVGDAPPAPPSLTGASWIWNVAGHNTATPAGTAYMRKTFNVADPAAISVAQLRVNADDSHVTFVNGQQVAVSGTGNNAWQTSQVVNLKPLLVAGTNVIAIAGTNAAGSGGGAIAVAQLDDQRIVSDTTWKALAGTPPAPPAGWSTIAFDDSAWPAAFSAGAYGVTPWNQNVQTPATPSATNIKVASVTGFQVGDTITIDSGANQETRTISAVGTAGATGTGITLSAPMTIVHASSAPVRNVTRPGTGVTFEPALTQAQDQGAAVTTSTLGTGITFTPALDAAHASGANVTGSGNPLAALDASAGAQVTPRLIGRLEVTFTDGTSQTIVTDRDWRAAFGPAVTDHWFGGTDYDARRELADPADLSDAAKRRDGSDVGWRSAGIAPAPNLTTKLAARTAEPVKVQKTFTPVKLTNPSAGVWVFDFGQNFAGWPEVHVPSGFPAGTVIKMLPGETLNANGTVNQASIGVGGRGSDIFATYTTNGGAETWHPQFNYFAMQYLQVTGLPAGFTPTTDLIRGLQLSANVAKAGDVETSNERINRLHSMSVYSTQSNQMSTFTDCPGREKLPYGADYVQPIGSLNVNFDYAAYLRNMEVQLVEGQSKQGADAGNVALKTPVYDWGYSGQFGDEINWGSSIVQVPWLLHKLYGDTQTMREHWDAMKTYMDFVARRKAGTGADAYIVTALLADWVSNEQTSQQMFGTWGYYLSAKYMSQMAALIGRTADAATYGELAANIKTAYNNRFYNTTLRRYTANGNAGTTGATQAAQAIALDAGLAPETDRGAILQALVENIYAYAPFGGGPHFSAGHVGLGPVVRSLMEGGRSDVLWDVMQENTRPSYGFMLAPTAAHPEGMTTMPERWTLGDSQNHVILLQIEEWFHTGVAGIKQAPSSIAYRDLIYKPTPVGDLTHAKGHYTTPQGTARSEWRRNQTGITRYDVSVPANTRATVYVPANSAAQTFVATGSGDARHLRYEDGYQVYDVAPGDVTFLQGTSAGGSAGGTVPATLSLALGAPASFGAFTPGVDRNYDASTTATVISTAGDATLSVADPSATAAGRLVNGTFALAEPLQARANSGAFAPLPTTAATPLSLLTYTAPVSNDVVSLGFRQHIASNQALRTGSYSKTLTFTLSTTTP